MSQTSTERLRDYLAQLPPQAQALLMREFERAIERGEDTAVATFVLEQLRKVVRGTEEDEEAQPRTDDPARLLFRPIEPFLVESNFPMRPGQIRRTSLLPVWQWLGRDGAPDAARAFEAALAEIRQSGSTAGLEAQTRKFQHAAAEAIAKVATPAPGDDRHRALARIGPPNVVEDLLSIGAVLRAREAMDTLGSRLPSQLRIFSDAQIAAVTAALNVPSLQTPQLLPFALSLIMQRLAAPWQIIRLAIKMAASDDEIRVAATPYGIAVTIALHDLSFLAACLRTDIRRGQFDNVGEQLKTLHDGVRGLRTELDLRNDSVWGKQLTSIRADISNSLQSEIDSVPGRVRRILRQRADKDISAAAQDRRVRGRRDRGSDRFRCDLPHLCQRTRDQRGDAADLFRPAALRRAIHRGAGAVAARWRHQGARLPANAGQGGDPLLRGPVRPGLCLADEPGGRKRRHRRAQIRPSANPTRNG